MTAQSGLSTDRWYFTTDQIANSPSFKRGIINAKETSYRQHAALLIQEIGQKLKVNQLCINTAIVYMHRFFMCHPFDKFARNRIAKASIFLSAKVEEQPRRLEHVINTAHFILTTGTQPTVRYVPLEPHSEEYKKEVEELIRNETIILQTLGFEVTVDHPHTHVVRAVQQLKVINGPSNENGSGGPPYLNDLARSSYFMATESLHLSTFCLQYKPNLVAAVCVHIACKWAKYEIDHPDPNCNWWELLGSDITLESLNAIAGEFLKILEVTPTKLKTMLHHAPHIKQRPAPPPHVSSRKGENLKRPRQEDHTDHQRSNHSHASGHKKDHEPARAQMEKSVSDKLDMLIGANKTKAKPSSHELANREHLSRDHVSSRDHHNVHIKKEEDSKRHHTNHERSNHSEAKQRTITSTSRQIVHSAHHNRKLPKLPSAPEMKYHEVKHEHHDKYSNPQHHVLKKIRVDPNHSRTSDQMKKLEQRMKSEQLEHNTSKPHKPRLKKEEHSPPPPPPPPPLQRAPVPQISTMRCNMPPPPLHNMPRQTDLKHEHRHPG